MSAQDLAARLEAARRFTFTAGGVVFTLRRPTAHEARLLFVELEEQGGATAPLRFQRSLLERAIVGWSGLSEHHLTGESLDTGAPPVPVPFESAIVPVILDQRPDWESALGPALMSAMADARAGQEAATKN